MRVLIILAAFCAVSAHATKPVKAKSKPVPDRAKMACVRVVVDLYSDTCGEADDEDQAECVLKAIENCDKGLDPFAG